jgi:hypothetical protein
MEPKMICLHCGKHRLFEVVCQGKRLEEDCNKLARAFGLTDEKRQAIWQKVIDRMAFE